MSTESTPLQSERPDYGKNPDDYNRGENPPVDDRSRPPLNRIGHRANPLLNFLNKKVVAEFKGPKGGSPNMPQYAIQKQKIVTMTESLLKLLQGEDPDKKLLIGTAKRQVEKDELDEPLTSIISDRANRRIIPTDCPDISSDGVVMYTVLLDWAEDTKETFPDVLIKDLESGETTRFDTQTNNFLVVSGMEDDGGDPHNPPPGPPVTGSGPLNTQISDFKVATEDDITHYQKLNGQDKGPSVAVIDTGLKFNLHASQWPDGAYSYRQANGNKRQFKLAYQDPSVNACEGVTASNPLGYCALQSYREDESITKIMPLPLGATMSALERNERIRKVKDSPYDDFRLFDSVTETTVQEARHGTSVTAIIQQNGDDAPVLVVKSFDNMGFATLFDVLNGFNYILHRCESANIRVVNASWIFGRDEPMLRVKIEQLMEKGVFVVAAAGNERQTSDRNLDIVKVYPACYSQKYPNVITVTSVRKTYLPPKLMSYRGDSVVGKLLGFAIGKLGLFDFLNKAGNLVDAVLPTRGYIAVENYSPSDVNVGVVSTFGFFPSPFRKGKPIRGSSYACAFISGFVIKRLRTGHDPLPLLSSIQPMRSRMMAAREKLLEAMSGRDQENLEPDYVAGGYYLAGHDVD
ncbi:S8/S53 family peptidase [Spirosoma validum]|uniref:S8/S53 family peptidase n=1 Tax=Spirosoma validum TaxID=2771355 RepID=A0A927GF41_9BACT|nr:S8/S53 family peptidase [Spirosoma validum]MBD2755321.1 S8/S53 family peptidase [Spirosoma validum]